jgi:hypothetical protein
MDLFIAWTVYSMEAVLLWRLLSWKAWRSYPLFLFYFLFLLARQAAIASVRIAYGVDSMAYSQWFWYSSTLSDVLKFVVAWEVYRNAFQAGSAAQRFAGALLVAVLTGLAVFYFVGGAHDTNFWVAVGLNLTFTVTVWMFGVLALGQYYRIPLGRNVWGIALGIGIYLSTAVVNLSMLGLDDRAFPLGTQVRRLSFSASVAIWIWALWSYRPPSTTLPPASPPGSRSSIGLVETTADAMARALGMRKP